MALSRRKFIGAVGACAALGPLKLEDRLSAEAGSRVARKVLPTWQEGTLEFHHIATGRGNSTFIIGPDGTTFLIDAGAIYDPPLYTIGPKPNGSRRPGEWIARYIQRRLNPGVSPAIDYAMLTHFHGDHIGQSVPGLPKSRRGDFELTGDHRCRRDNPNQFADRPRLPGLPLSDGVA